MDGKGLIELKEEEIKNFGLNLGQRKKIIKYINYFKRTRRNRNFNHERKFRRKS